jgi:hypothetical protein
MTMRSALAPALLGTLALAAFGCGTSGGSEAQPIEVLYYVSGAQGSAFEFVSDADPACGSSGTGIQSPNSDHQFAGRIFSVPHLFVLENAFQPVRAVIRNLSPAPIQVDMYLGLIQAVGGSEGMIAPGACRAIASGPQRFTIDVAGPQMRTEVCAPSAGLSVSCISAPPPPDRFIAFSGSTGDLRASVLTNCQLNPFLDACRTPATFFWQNPLDQFNAVMAVNGGQSPEGQPPAELRAELYVNDTLQQFATGAEPILGYER